MSSKCILMQTILAVGIAAMAAFVLSAKSSASLADDPTSSTVAELVEGLRHESGAIRAEAAARLMQLGPRAQPAMSLLLAGLNDESALVRAHSAGALGRLGPAAVAALTRALDHPETLVRRGAAAALCIQDADAWPAREALERLVNDADPSVRYLAAQSLLKIDACATASAAQ